MSRRDLVAFDSKIILDQSAADITQLCYLGLHQYAKENNLIGRSRPLIDIHNMNSQAIRRLYFRLTVACIKEIIGSTHLTHGDDVQQVNYLNVHHYRNLRLYGLLDRKMFVAWQTDEDGSGRAYSVPIAVWPESIRMPDAHLLRGHQPINDIFNALSVRTRAILELGGEIFENHLRTALQYLPEDGLPTHVQYDTVNRRRIKNIAINLSLFELPYFAQYSGNLELPRHIESVMWFRSDIWPLIQTLMNEEVREHFVYVASNFPGPYAIQTKARDIEQSRAEQQRRERMRQQAEAEHGRNVETLRDRLVSALGRPPRMGRNARELDDEVTCPHCLTPVGPNTNDECECGRFRRFSPLTTPVAEPDEEPEFCDACGEEIGDCMCDEWCYDCDHHIDECTCGIEVEEDPDAPILICTNCRERVGDCECTGLQHVVVPIAPNMVVSQTEINEDLDVLRRRVHEALGIRLDPPQEEEE